MHLLHPQKLSVWFITISDRNPVLNKGFPKKKMLLCTSIIALISLILIFQSKATFFPKEIWIWMSHLCSQARHHSEGGQMVFMQYLYIKHVRLLGLDYIVQTWPSRPSLSWSDIQNENPILCNSDKFAFVTWKPRFDKWLASLGQIFIHRDSSGLWPKMHYIACRSLKICSYYI